MVVVEQLHKRLGGRPVLAGVSLSLERGERLALQGVSGAGKTTLLRLIAGLDDADAGRVLIDGALASNPRVLVPRRRRLGMVFQDLALWPHLTAGGNVEFMLPPAFKGRRRRADRVQEVLQSVGLEGYQARYPHQLSRGQQQRVALARALAGAPEVLLLDEPFSSLDAEARDQLIELVGKLHQAQRFALIYVTHTTDELPRLADRVVHLRNGVLEQPLPPES
jgi:ABC-type Fe3+/spermidine/putrescine transport system ATPase subunit